MALDASIPKQETLGDELDVIHRETRAAVNANAAAILAGTLPGMTNEIMAAAAQAIDAEGSVAINITMAGPPNNLVNLTGAYSGQFVILRLDEGEAGLLTVVHNALIIDLQEDLNFIMHAGDVLILLNKGGVPGISNGVWYEIHRQLYDAVLELISPNGTRYRLFVDNFSALNVVTL